MFYSNSSRYSGGWEFLNFLQNFDISKKSFGLKKDIIDLTKKY